jgi:hypothetical protein
MTYLPQVLEAILDALEPHCYTISYLDISQVTSRLPKETARQCWTMLVNKFKLSPLNSVVLSSNALNVNNFSIVLDLLNPYTTSFIDLSDNGLDVEMVRMLRGHFSGGIKGMNIRSLKFTKNIALGLNGGGLELARFIEGKRLTELCAGNW